MSLPIGGIADKLGNKYEYDYVVLSILKVLDGKIEYIEYEPIKENGIDIIQCSAGILKYQQCKVRNGSDENWSISSLAKNVLPNWKKILTKSKNNKVSLVSPIPFTKLKDISDRANKYTKDPKEFILEIDQLGTDSLKVFEGFCNIVIGRYDINQDIDKIVDYLCRISFETYPENLLEEYILKNIHFLFNDDEKKVYTRLCNWVISGEIFRKKIYINDINTFIIKNNFTLRELATNNNNIVSINKVNTLFKNDFEPFDENNMIVRDVSKEIYDIVMHGDSCIIKGEAGVGKSGCMMNLVEMCEKNHIPYIGIKLDKYVPINNTDEWGKTLGLICSPTYCLDAISKNSNCVIFLDQLDTLRWLQIENYNWTLVLESLLEEIKNLNNIRTKKIALILSVRNYDLEYDHVIKKIIKQISFESKEVGSLSEKELNDSIGIVYYNLTEQEKNLLSVPSNLFIWKQLEDENKKSINSTKKLIDNWIMQIIEKAKNTAIDANSIKNLINNIAELCIKNKKNWISEELVRDNSDIIKYLIHEKFLKKNFDENSISFYHQTIYDALLTDKKIDAYAKTKKISSIIGNRENQNPKNRYILKMFLEVKLLDNIDECLNIFDKILYSNSKEIRFSYKHLVLELLSRYKKPNKKVNLFVVNKIKEKMWNKYFIYEVVMGNVSYIEYLIDIGLIDEWIDNNVEMVIDLFKSICTRLSSKCTVFIKKYLFLNSERDEKIYKILPYAIHNDNDEAFKLRLYILARYPNFISDSYIDINELFRINQNMGLDILSMLIINKIKIHNIEKILHTLNCEENEKSNKFESNYKNVLEKILPILPKMGSNPSCEWNGYESYSLSLERLAIEYLKKANFYLIKNTPNAFFDVYKSYMYTDNKLFNEIILDGFYWLNQEYSSRILEYLSSNFNQYAFDLTSSYGNKLDLACRVIQKHTMLCDSGTYQLFEDNVIKYKEENLILDYKYRSSRRYEYKDYNAWNLNIWGNFQFKILTCINKDLLSPNAKNLLCCLNRSVLDKNYFDKPKSHFGTVTSPVADKELCVRQWEYIITNAKIFNSKRKTTKTKGGFVESSPEMFASSFSNSVANRPIDFIKMMLKQKKPINDVYIASFFSGLANSKHLNDISEKLLENVFEKFNIKSEKNVNYFLEIIRNKDTCSWSENIYLTINDLFAKYGKNVKLNKENYKLDDLYNCIFNSVFGNVCLAISHIIYIDDSKIFYFEKAIEEYKETSNLINKFCLLFIMRYFPKKYADCILEYCLDSPYFLAIDNIIYSIAELYSKDNKEKIIKIIKLGILSKNKILQENACELLFFLYAKKNLDFRYVVKINNECPKIMIKYLIYYIKKCRNSKGIKKTIVNTLIKNSDCLEIYSCTIIESKILDYNTDKKIILKLIKSGNYAFCRNFISSLEKSNDLLKYYKLIFKLSKELIVNSNNKNKFYEMDEELFTSINALYNLSINRNDKIKNNCLDILDLMYEYRIGSARMLYLEMIK